MNVFIQPRPRALHAAVSTDEYLLLFGGRTFPHNASDALVAYSYACNFWLRIMDSGKYL
jgi:hypothetical protein